MTTWRNHNGVMVYTIGRATADRAHATRAALYAIAHWGGRVAVLRRPVTHGTEWLTLSSHSGEHGAFVASAAVGDSVMVGGYEAVVVEVWGNL